MSNRLVVIGGGSAGTGAAATAKQYDRSASVTLITEFEDIAYSPCGMPYVIGREVESFDKLFLQSRQFYLDMGLDLQFTTTVDRIDINQHQVHAGQKVFPFDKLILCTGWEYAVPNLPGVDLAGIEYIKVIRRVMELDKRLDQAKRVVVWQAKPVSVELVDALPNRGLETHLVDSGSWLMSDFADPDVVDILHKHLEKKGVHIHLGTELLGFTGKDGHLTAVQTSNGEIPCEIAILVPTMKPATQLAQSIGIKTGSTGAIVVDDHMRTNIPDVYAAGACIEVLHGLLKMPVNLVPGTYAYAQGRIAGTNAVGGDRAYQPVYVPWGLSAGVQVGGVPVSEAIAKAMGMPYILGKASGITAARYHPAHEPMYVKLLVDPKTHRLIGGQCAGGEGVKERAEFLAFAIRKEAVIEELATMENVYSPPIGALNEPIVTAANNALAELRK